MRRLMQLPRGARWGVALLLALPYLALLVALFALPARDARWLPALVVGPFLLAPLESLLLTPLFALTGRFTYRSPMLLTTRAAASARASGGALELHTGTLFDYVTELRWARRGPATARVVLVEIVRGLLAIVAAVERGDLPATTELRVTSYVFSDRTLARLGFRFRPAPPLARLNLAVVVLSVAVRLAYVRGRFSLPDLGRVRQGVIPAGELARRGPALRAMLARLTSRSLPPSSPARAGRRPRPA